MQFPAGILGDQLSLNRIGSGGTDLQLGCASSRGHRGIGLAIGKATANAKQLMVEHIAVSVARWLQSACSPPASHSDRLG